MTDRLQLNRSNRSFCIRPGFRDSSRFQSTKRQEAVETNHRAQSWIWLVEVPKGFRCLGPVEPISLYKTLNINRQRHRRLLRRRFRLGKPQIGIHIPTQDLMPESQLMRTSRTESIPALNGSATIFSRSNKRMSWAVSGLPVVSSFSP